MANVAVNPEILRWAVERSGLDEAALDRQVPGLFDWIEGKSLPTLKKLEKFARKTFTPLGYLFLDVPPDETLPVSVFRTVGDKPIHTPSPNLLETVHTMQRRQDWVREFLAEEGNEPLPFVGSATLKSNVADVADSIRKTLGIREGWAKQQVGWQGALVALRELLDAAGIFFVRNGVVGNNRSRILDVEEFRGFVLVDKYAPMIFVNGRDSEGAQMFTVAHELAHIWIGQSAIFNLLNLQPFDNESEVFCNKVAAEFLVPEKEFRVVWKESERKADRYKAISAHFKVSRLVVARRALDLGFLGRREFSDFFEKYRDEVEEAAKQKKGKKKSGGDFYKNQNVRVGKKFAAAVFQATKQGRLLYHDAFRLTGLYGNTFDKYMRRLGL